MAVRRETARRLGLLAALAVLTIAAGCGAPPATLELISVGQEALAEASEYHSAQHASALEQLARTQSALDAAFDADAGLVEAGKITDPSGKPVPLTADWVISARKGYAAGREALAEQRRRLEAAHATHLDNLAAASEALELAKRLIIQHSSLAARAHQFVMSLQRRSSNDRRNDQ
jgi:hypothetical protein